MPMSIVIFYREKAALTG